MAHLRRGEQRPRQERYRRQDVAFELFDLIPSQYLKEDRRVEREVRTSTGCTTATSFLDGAG